jgi:periplasmic divalent cation tolerance protein
MEKAYLVILITAPNQEVSENIAHSLVEGQFAACVNILPGMTSIYRWKGAVEREQEYLLVCKTRRERFDDRFIAAVHAIHPYEVPEIIALPIEAGAHNYLDWIASETGEKP